MNKKENSTAKKENNKKDKNREKTDSTMKVGDQDKIPKKFLFQYTPETCVLYVAAFLVPLLLMVYVLKSGGFYPFGEKTLFIMDMKGQYLEFFASLRNTVTGDDSLFFSWSRSMGGNYLGLFAYYVASPLSFITLFFSIKNLTAAITVLIVLKVGLCGLSFAVFGQYLWKRSQGVPGEAEEKKGSCWRVLLILPFAVSYAFISYNMVYSLCLMWLDGVILLPVVLLGVEKLLDGRKGLHYMLGLAALFICNYYTGYMVGIFTAMYFVMRILSEVKKEKIRECLIKTGRFTITTLLAFGLSAPLILPVVKDLMQGKLASAAYCPDTKTNFVLADLIGKFHNGVYDSITNSGLPAVYCGYLVILLAVGYFFMKKIRIREKVGAAVIFLVMILSFYFTDIDIAWHGFQYPTWFPYRYAFVFSFLLVYMAVRTVCAIPWDAKPKCWMPICIAAVIVVIADMGTNASAMLKGLDGEFHYGTVEEYEAFIDKTEPLVNGIAEKDTGFYRINQGYEYSKNDAMLLGYNGMTHYSSTYNAAVNTLTPKLGIAQSHIWNSGYGSTPLLDSLFAVRYILADRQVPAAYTPIGQTEAGTASYENATALSIAYAAPIQSMTPDLSNVNPFVNQNTLLNTIAGTQESYFTECPYTQAQQDANWTYTFTAASDNPVYLYMKSDTISWADVYVNGVWIGNYFSTETSCNLYLGSFAAGQTVEVQVVPSQALTVYTAVIGELHMDILGSTLQGLQSNGMQVNKHASGAISGMIRVADGQKIITSIPYDTGWTVRIDGKKVKTEIFADTFLAVEAGSGEHTISFSYVSPGFKTGMILFVIAAVLSVFYYLKRKRTSKMVFWISI